LQHKATVVTGWRFLLAVVVAGAFLPFMGGIAPISDITSRQAWTLVAIAFSTGMVALWIYYRGLRFTEARVATILELASPLAAIVIDILWYRNFLEGSQYLAAAVLVYATWRVARLNRAA
jgi:drug/metabolite transporter (DMT)-like permease